MGTSKIEIVERMRDLASRFGRFRYQNFKNPVCGLLNELADDIESDKNLDGWNRLNLSDHVANLVEPMWYSRLVNRFGMLIPIAFSWWSIRAATTSYAKLTSAQLESKSFLYWWVEGMDGRLASFEKLPNAALSTFVVISIMGVFGLIAGIPSAKARREVIEVAHRAQVYIGQRATITPDELRGSVKSLMLEMVSAANNLDVATNQSRQVISEISDQLGALKTYVDSQTNLVGGELKNVMTESTLALVKISSVIDSAKDVAVTLAHSSKTLESSIVPVGEMIKGVDNLANTSLKASETLRDMVDRVPGSFHEPIGAIISAGEFLSDAVAEIMKQMSALESMYSMIGHARGAGEIQTLLQRIENSSNQLALVQQGFGSEVSNLNSELSPLITAVHSLASEVDLLRTDLSRFGSHNQSLLQRIENSSNQLALVQQGFGSEVSNLNSESSPLITAVHSLTSELDQLRTHLSRFGSKKRL